MSQHLLMALGSTLLGVFAMVYPILALQPPDLPFSPYGTIKVNNNDVPDGTTVTASCSDVPYRQTTATTTSGASWYFNLDIPGDDPETTNVKEGCTPTETVTFKIGDLTANQTMPWVSGSTPRLDLTAIDNSTRTPTTRPTETRTPTTTPTATATGTKTSTRTPTGAPIATATRASTLTRTPTGAPRATPTRISTSTRTPTRTSTTAGASSRTPTRKVSPRKMLYIPLILRP